MDPRLHIFFKSLLGRGVNVVATEKNHHEHHLYLATTDLSLLKKTLNPALSTVGRAGWYVHITLSPGLDHCLPLLLEVVVEQSQVSPCPSFKAWKPPRCHVATNHVKISSDKDMEQFKKALLGVTSFNIWRDGDEELTEEAHQHDPGDPGATEGEAYQRLYAKG